jgi:soluble lytic murein transglycosylase-like protein
MSTATLSAAAGDATAAAQRVQQLQTLLAQAQQGGSTAGFAAALRAAAAGAPGAAGADQTSTTAGAAASGLATSPSTIAPSATAGASMLAAAGAGASPAGVPVSASGYVTPAATTPATITPPAGSSTSSPYDATIAQAATRYDIDPAILHGLIQQESGFDPNARSSAGALGLTQLMPGTASSLGVTNPLDPTQSIEGGARYLSEMLSKFGGNTAEALAAYNAGPGAVSQYGGVPPYAETQAYVNKVLGYADAYRQSLPATTTASSSTRSIA